MILIIYLIIFVIMALFFVIIPNKKQKSAHDSLLNNLEINDVVTTSGGIIGKVMHVGEKDINIKSLNSEMKINKYAIISVDKEEQ